MFLSFSNLSLDEKSGRVFFCLSRILPLDEWCETDYLWFYEPFHECPIKRYDHCLSVLKVALLMHEVYLDDSTDRP